jgi:DUF917 family protein
MKLSKTQIRQIIESSTILGTGGGGRLDSAMSVIEKLPPMDLISFNDLGPDDIVITAYGAGGLTKPKNTTQVMTNGLELLQKQLGKPIKAIVPVEIGPYSLAAAFEIAAQLNIPVVDGDLVGYRSVPEIYIELVTLADLSRCPLVFGNNEGDLVLLDKASNPERLEQIIRSFADESVSNTFVLGYPYKKADLNKCLAKDSVSYCLTIKDELEKDFQLVCNGTVKEDVKKEQDGFTRGYLIVESKDSLYRVEFKNEYLVLLKGEDTVVTCPDFICVLDETNGLGINNGDDNTGKQVRIYVRPAIKEWRTKDGLGLFTPEKLGLSYKQKVMGSNDDI